MAVSEVRSRYRRSAKSRAYDNAYLKRPHVVARRNNARWKRKYGITAVERTAMLQRQGNRCAICCTDKPGKRGWVIDHCHQTNVVRGILCHTCNAGLGLLKDSPLVVGRALAYLLGINLQ